MRNTVRWGLAAIASLAVSSAWSQSIWQSAHVDVDAKSNPVSLWLDSYQTFKVSPEELRNALSLAPHQEAGQFYRFSIIDLPLPNGRIGKYKICESPIMSSELEKRLQVKTYRVQGILNPAENGRLDLGPNGFHGFVRSPDGQSFLIDPVKLGDQSGVFVYYRHDNFSPRNFLCFTQPARDQFNGNRLGQINPGGWSILSTGATLKTYRLAMNADGEYQQFFGGVTQSDAAVATSINRINSVYEIENAIHLQLTYVKSWPDPNTDPYTNDNGFTMLDENQTETDASVGDANYDMGHVFSTGGGGVANINSVGVTGSKAMGVTGLPGPVGDDFDIDYVAHEMGHQFGGRHTFNGTSGACGGARDTPSYEPGSGSTIMAYAGICAPEDLQPHSDPYMHLDSLERITQWRDDAQSHGSETNTGNRQPTANAGGDYTIPRGTPFKLTATGSDPDGDAITYCWEDFDLGTASPTTDNSTRPLFRSFNPTVNPSRTFPKLATYLAGTNDPYEFVPDVDRAMVFRVTVRDNHSGSGGYAFDEMNLTVAGAPFKALEPSTPQSWLGGSQQTVTWDPGGSTSANVNIYLSLDGGLDYGTGASKLALANAPNNGSATINVPNFATSKGRIVIEGAGNVFFDVTKADITVTQIATQPPTITSINPNSTLAGTGALTLTVTGVNFETNSVVRWFGVDRPTTFIDNNTLQAAIGASDVAFGQIVPIQVVTPPPGGGSSNIVSFTINNPVPTLATITPSLRAAGGGAFSLTLTGTNFVSSSKVTLNGVSRNAVFISTTKISTTVTAAEAANPATYSVRVVNGTPGGGTSGAQTLKIVKLAPASIAIFPGSITGGQTATAAVYLNGPAPAGGFPITLSKTGSAIGIPGTVTAAQGKYSAVFSITSTPVVGDALCTVKATANGVTVSKSIVVKAPVPVLVKLNPSSLNAGESTTGTLTLSGPAPAGGMNITLASGVPSLVHVPAVVFVAAGQKTKSFTVTTSPYNQSAAIAVWALYHGKGAFALLQLN